MYVVKVEVKAIKDGDVVSGTISKQRKRSGGTWVAEDSVVVVSGQPGSDRDMVLEDDQRIIVEMTSNVETVYDKEQMAVVLKKTEVTAKPTPGDRDGDEKDTPDLVKESQSPSKVKEAEAQEKRDAALTAARQQVSSSNKREEKK